MAGGDLIERDLRLDLFGAASHVAYVCVMIFYVVEISVGARLLSDFDFTEYAGIGAPLDQPATALVQGLLLNYQPVHVEVLGLYCAARRIIVLLAAFPPVLWLLLRSPVAALAGSVSSYELSRQLDWNLAAFPAGDWRLDPLSWQLLFVLGAWLAVYRRRGVGPFPLRSAPTAIFAGVYLVSAFAVQKTIEWGEFTTSLWLRELAYPTGEPRISLALPSASACSSPSPSAGSICIFPAYGSRTSLLVLPAS